MQVNGAEGLSTHQISRKGLFIVISLKSCKSPEEESEG